MKKDSLYKEEKVHFRVDFEGLTQLCRDFWSEGEYQKALVIMTESGISLKDAHDVIRGKLKMIQFPGSKEGVEGTLAKDNWKPNPNRCMWSKYPDPTDTAYFRMIERYGVKGLTKSKNHIEGTLRELENSTNALDHERLVNHLKELQIDDEIYHFFGYEPFYKLEKKWRPRRVTFESSQERADYWIENDFVPMTWSGSYPPNYRQVDVDAYIKRQLELDKITEKPKPCKPPQRTGWLSPKGEMFACNYNEHRWLSELLGFNTEKDIEKAGWVKLHYMLLNPDQLLIAKGNEKKRLTQKQIDALWDWATHNKVDPDYIGEILENEDDL